MSSNERWTVHLIIQPVILPSFFLQIVFACHTCFSLVRFTKALFGWKIFSKCNAIVNPSPWASCSCVTNMHWLHALALFCQRQASYTGIYNILVVYRVVMNNTKKRNVSFSTRMKCYGYVALVALEQIKMDKGLLNLQRARSYRVK